MVGISSLVGLTRLRRTLMVALLAAFLSLGLLAVASPRAVLAQDPMRLQNQVTDLTRGQVLGMGRSQIEAALSGLRQTRNVQLFVLFVETTGTRTITEYADEVGRASCRERV